MDGFPDEAWTKDPSIHLCQSAPNYIYITSNICDPDSCDCSSVMILSIQTAKANTVDLKIKFDLTWLTGMGKHYWLT